MMMKKFLWMTVFAFVLFVGPSVQAEFDVTEIVEIKEANRDSYVVQNEHIYLGGKEGLHIYRLDTGKLVHQLGNQAVHVLAVNEEETRIVTKEGAQIRIYDETGTLLRSIESFSFGDKSVRVTADDLQASFLPHSSQLVLVSRPIGMVFYDVETDQVTLLQNDHPYGQLRVSAQQVAVQSGRQVYMYDVNGRLVNVFGLEESTSSFDLTTDGILVYNKPNGEIGVIKPDEPSIFIRDLGIRGVIDLDDSGTFLSNEDTLFDFKTGKKIYASLQPGRYIFTPDATKFVSFGKKLIVYDAADLNKRIKTIKINPELKQIMLGEKVTPSLVVTRVDGKTEVITEGIKWRAAPDFKIVYKNGKFVTSINGPATLYAEYEGYDLLLNIKILLPPPLTDLEWLNSHKASLEKRRTFVGGDYKLFDAYSKVRGPAGKLLFNKKVVTSGKFNGDWIFASTKNKQRVDEIVFSFTNYRRNDITASEVNAVFGKPNKAWNEKGHFEVIRGTKHMEKRYITRVAEHRIRPSQALWVYYDANGKARMVRYFETVPK